jgi:subtilisin family serine protease
LSGPTPQAGKAPGSPQVLLAIVIAAWFVLGLMPAGAAFAASGTPNDPLFASQWNLRMIGAPAAWQYSTGKGVIVGLVDTGVDLSHPDLAGQVLASTNCIGAAGDPAHCKGSGQDDNGHGTHVAGIIDALTNNGIGVASVAPDAKLVVAKALDSSGAGDDADVEAGIEWVVNHGARVVNLSLGDASTLPVGLGSSGGISQPLADGITYAWQHGAIPVLAAGNNGGGLGSAAGGLLGPELGTDAAFGALPAIVVGAVGPTGAVAGYSSTLTADRWGLVAPGGAADGNPADDVVSTYWVSGRSNQYAALAGTSMATPHVTGAIADLLALGYSQQSAITRLLATADSAVACGTSCAGLLDLSAAVGGPPVPPPAAGPAPNSTGADPLGLGALLGSLGL